MPKRELPEVNAGSMADIAFTLLIFFLVSTTLATDKGEKVMLPKWDTTPKEDRQDVEVHERNVFAVDVLEDGSLVVEGKPFNYKNLKEETITFLMNNGKNSAYSDSYQDAVVNVRTHPDAPYEKYLEVYSNVKKAFNDIRDNYAQQKYGKKYDEFNENEVAASQDVRSQFPLKLAEKLMDEDDLKK